LVEGDPNYLWDPNNQIRIYETLRVGQRWRGDFTACDEDGDPIGSIVPGLISDDLVYTVDGPNLGMLYHARGPKARREIVTFVLTDAPIDPNIVPASRIVAFVFDVRKNRPPKLQKDGG
jgi:hypothetical protein